MKRWLSVMIAALAVPAASALADKAPAAEAMGSALAASHLAAHIYARSDGWNGVLPSHCEDEGCADYGHIHCYGRRVALWDTPAKGDSRVPYYPGGMVGRVGPDTELELIGVVAYQGAYYANVRVYEEGRPRLCGFISADYLGCDCDTYDAFEEVPQYEHNVGSFSLK